MFALPLGTVEHVAPGLVEKNQAWRDLVGNVKTTATQAMQIWVDRPAAELGWFEDAVVGGYDAPTTRSRTCRSCASGTAARGSDGAVPVRGAAGRVLRSTPGSDEDAASWVRGARPTSRPGPRSSPPARGGLWPEPSTRRPASTTRASRWRRTCAAISSRRTGTCCRCPVRPLPPRPGRHGFQNLVIAGDWTRW